MNKHAHTHVRINMCVYMCMYMYTYTHIYVCMYVCMSPVSINTCICTYICVYVKGIRFRMHVACMHTYTRFVLYIQAYAFVSHYSTSDKPQSEAKNHHFYKKG